MTGTSRHPDQATVCTYRLAAELLLVAFVLDFLAGSIVGPTSTICDLHFAAGWALLALAGVLIVLGGRLLNVAVCGAAAPSGDSSPGRV